MKSRNAKKDFYGLIIQTRFRIRLSMLMQIQSLEKQKALDMQMFRYFKNIRKYLHARTDSQSIDTTLKRNWANGRTVPEISKQEISLFKNVIL